MNGVDQATTETGISYYVDEAVDGVLLGRKGETGWLTLMQISFSSLAW